MQTKMEKALNSKRTIKILGWILVVIIPLVLIGYTYGHSYYQSQQVAFDDTSDKVNSFISYDDLVDLELIIDWVNYDAPVKNAENAWVNGKYSFHISYLNQGSTPIYNVYVLPVLQVDWTEINARGELKPISMTSVTAFDIEFNHPLPIKPLYFISEDDPVLYLKVSYQVEVSGSLVTKIKYVEYSLDDLYPST